MEDMTTSEARSSGASARLTKAWRANVRKIHPRLTLAHFVARMIPHDMFNHRRAAVYRAAGVRVGRHAQILGPLTILGWGNIARFLQIGDDVALETPCTISLCAPVRIGHRVHTGPDVMILTGTHKIGEAALRCGAYEFAPVDIGDGCWLGARIVILPGVTIGAGCVVAAGSIVTRSMPSNSMVAGNPARVVGRLDSVGIQASAGVSG